LFNKDKLVVVFNPFEKGETMLFNFWKNKKQEKQYEEDARTMIFSVMCPDCGGRYKVTNVKNGNSSSVICPYCGNKIRRAREKFIETYCKNCSHSSTSWAYMVSCTSGLWSIKEPENMSPDERDKNEQFNLEVIDPEYRCPAFREMELVVMEEDI